MNPTSKASRTAAKQYIKLNEKKPRGNARKNQARVPRSELED